MDVGDFQLDDSLHKCRCCFRMLIDEGKAIEITEAVESKFFDLTQIQVSFEACSMASGTNNDSSF